ncbi:NCS2 family permease [Mesoplasma photuris]|uniref:NCS2 family permease n=1 Tax=Mesoplasma photuris TaxID=217731 RepID=UPI00068CE70A|nr:NCS2 family permease [Mesoplasma photuris]
MEKEQNTSIEENLLFEEFGNETPQMTAERNAKNFVFSNNKAIAAMERYFKFDTLGAIWKKEILGGLATFLALIYILSVNPAILSSAESVTDPTNPAANMDSFGVFLATAIASAIASIVMGLFANIPVAVSTSMGMNAMMVFNLANVGGLGYEGALIATMLSSILFVIVSITPLRRMVIKAIPKQIVIAFGIGIGFFIATVGLTDMGWLMKSDSGVPIAAISKLQENYPLILIGMGTLGLILFLHFKKVPGSAAIGILAGFIVAVIVANTVSEDSSLLQAGGALSNTNFRDPNWGWDYQLDGFTGNIENTWKQFTNVEIWNKPVMYISIFVFMFMNFFDATGTLASFNHQLNKRTNQHHEISHKALVIDSGATVVGAALGTSPMGVYVESAAGIEQGARTGVAAIVNGLLFVVAIALYPIFKAIPACVTSAACIYIGMMMVAELKLIDWKKPEIAISAFLVILFMVTTYNIANGIAFGIIGYTFIKTVTGKIKEVGIVMWVLSLLFVGYFISLAFIVG